jgi:hypothetical protein
MAVRDTSIKEVPFDTNVIRTVFAPGATTAAPEA